jgi:hypothetical protein
MTERVGRLIFLDAPDQVLHVKREICGQPGTKLVALTAETAQYCEEIGLAYEPVCRYADGAQLAAYEEEIAVQTYRLANEIESFIAHRYPPARLEGPGILTGQVYYCAYSVHGVAMRAFLMREAIRALQPQLVTLFRSEVDSWFHGDGYEENPWVQVMAQLAEAGSFSFELLPPAAAWGGFLDDARASRGVTPTLNHWSRLPSRVLRYGARSLSRAFSDDLDARSARISSFRSLAGLRLLFVERPGYDWTRVMAALKRVEGTAGFYLERTTMDGRMLTSYFSDSVKQLWRGTDHTLGVAPPIVSEEERATISKIFDEWQSLRQEPAALMVAGMNLFPSLARHLKHVASIGPSLARHIEEISVRALDMTQPDVLCCYHTAWFSSKRVAYHCRQRGIPVVVYQHGGAYFIQVFAKDELSDLSHADFILTYGDGIRPRVKTISPPRATCLPIGSTRVEAYARKFGARSTRNRRRINVLWVGEISSKNTTSITQIEDTQRYNLEKKCLILLSAATHLKTTFRPYPSQTTFDGVCRLLMGTGSRVGIDIDTPLLELIAGSDAVIIDASCANTWLDVIALKRPLILFFDPRQTYQQRHFADDLEKVCLWTKSPESLLEAVRRLAEGGWDFVESLRHRNYAPFITKYILHKEDGRCVDRALSFLSELTRTDVPAAPGQARKSEAYS